MGNYSNEPQNSAKKLAESSGIQAIEKDLKSIKDSSSKLVRDIKDTSCSMTKDSIDYLKNEGKKDMRKVEAYVKDHPVKSVAWAIGGGLLLSLLLRRR